MVDPDEAPKPLPDFRRKLTGEDYKAIARLAGVVERTVRRVFEGAGDASRDTVIAAAIRHIEGEQPEAVFGLVRPDVENQFFETLVSLLKRRLRSRRMLLTVVRSDEYVVGELEDLKFMVGDGINGVFYAQNPPLPASIRYLTDVTKTPVVLVDVDVGASELSDSHAWLGDDAVLVDNREGIEQALGYLVNENGHRVVSFLTGPVAASTARSRLDAFRTAAGAYRLPLDDDLILHGDYTFASGEAAANRLQMLHRREREPFPTAIICANDLMAAGLIKGLQRAGIKVPDQMSVVGFDHIPLTEWWTPTIATVDQKLANLADAAISSMLAKIGRPSGAPPDDRGPRLIAPELKRAESVIHQDRSTPFSERFQQDRDA